MKYVLISIFSIITLYSSEVLSCTESKDPEAVVQAQLDAYNAHDVEQFISCYSSDIKMQQLREGGPSLAGKKAFSKAYQFLKTVPKEYKVILENRMVNGPIVIDHERLTGLGKGEEDKLFIAIYEVRDGKITNLWFPVSQ